MANSNDDHTTSSQKIKSTSLIVNWNSALGALPCQVHENYYNESDLFLIYAYCILTGFHFNWHFDGKWFSLDRKEMVSAYQLQTLHVCDVVGQDLLTNWWVLYQSYPFWSSLHGSMESSQQWGPWKTGCAFRHILDNLPCPVVFFLAPVTTKLVFAIPSTLYSSPLRILFFVAWPEYLANSFFFKANL